MINAPGLLSALIIPLSFIGALPNFSSDTDNAGASQQILIKFRDYTSTTEIKNQFAKENISAIDKIQPLDVFVARVPEKASGRILAALSKNPLIEYAEPDYIAEAFNTPNDTYFNNQWGLENTGQAIVGVVGKVDADIDAPGAWNVSQSDVPIAVLDSGVDQDHEDISAKIVKQKNFTDSSTVDDLYGHGTHVSGIAAATTNNGTGVAGGCPNCKILNVKVLNDSGYGAYSWIANGITWAADNGAKVINLSLGGNTPSSTLERAVKYAWKKGVVVVAAAGNSANPSKTYPAAYTNAIAVAATNNQDQKASFSSYSNKWVDVAAPGENVFSTFPNHAFALGTKNNRSQNYDFGSGTSMSTPMVSAVAALIWSSSYGGSNSSVRSRLESTTDRIAGTGTYWSKGRINAEKSLTP